jgi:hypothetical protein
MRIPEDRRENAYNVISRDSLAGGTTVAIFCACDVDSMAAAAVLATLLKQDQVKFSQIPVSSREQLEAAFIGQHMTQDIRSIVLIGCGGGIDAGALLRRAREHDRRNGRRRGGGQESDYSSDSDEDEEDASKRIVFIVDPFLPYSRSNIENETTVLLFDASLLSEEEKRARQEADDGDVERELTDDPDDDTSQRLTCCGKPSSQVLFELARDLGKDTPHNRWLAWCVFPPLSLFSFYSSSFFPLIYLSQKWEKRPPFPFRLVFFLLLLLLLL